MAQAELSVLKDRIGRAMNASPIAAHLKSIALEPDSDEDGWHFLRVLVEVAALDRVSDADMAALVASIEEAVYAVDERFPSIRFADAA